MTAQQKNCGKIGDNARLCRSKQNSDRRIKHIQQDSEATSVEEDNWTPNKIHSINNTVHSTRQISKDGKPFFTVTVLVNNRPIKYIIDSGSPVTLKPEQKINGITTIYLLHEEYRDVNNKKIKFEGKTMANLEMDGEKTRYTDHHKKNKPITRIRLDETSGNKLKHRETKYANSQYPRRPRYCRPEEKIQETIPRK